MHATVKKLDVKFEINHTVHVRNLRGCGRCIVVNLSTIHILVDCCGASGNHMSVPANVSARERARRGGDSERKDKEKIINFKLTSVSLGNCMIYQEPMRRQKQK